MLFRQNPNFKTKKILVVDDEAFNLMALQNIIGTLGFYNRDELCEEA